MSSTIHPITSYLKPKKVFHAIRRRVEIPLFTCIDVLFDAMYNITTHSGRIIPRSDNVDPAFQDDAGYEPMSYFALQRLLKQVLVVPGEVLVDIGCGRGRVVCMFARRHSIAKCVGVEYHQEYAETARKNAAKLRGRQTPIYILEGNAAEQNYDDATLVFLFNPFGEVTMRRTIQQIGMSLKRRPRPLRLVYVNPQHEAILEEQSWLVKAKTFRIPYRLLQSGTTCIWQSI